MAYSKKDISDFLEKGQNIWKLGQKCTKYENSLKKGRWLHVLTAYKKNMLEQAL